jgi:hypothetical protein
MKPLRTLAPVFEHRFPIDAIRASYPSLEAAFDAGDYNLVANDASPMMEIKGCALVLCGLFPAGLEVLEALPELSPRGRLCLGIALWIAERSEEAFQVLAKLSPGHGASFAVGRELQRLIRESEIPVFVISAVRPLFTDEIDGLQNPVQRYGSFVVKHVGTQFADNAYTYDVSEPLDDFLSDLPAHERPLFLYSMTPQAILPRHYERVVIPKVMWCHDTDLFLYRGYDNFRLNDLNIVTTSQEHFELSRALGTPCASNLLSDTLCMPPRQTSLETEKVIDVLFTGSAVHTQHSEKSRFMYWLAKLSDEFEVRVVDGHLEEEEYFRLLSQARFVPIVNRYAGAVSPRWREGLALSAFLLHPEGTPFPEVAPGTFGFRSENIAADLRHHLTRYRDTGSFARSPYNLRETFPRVQRALSFLDVPRETQMERQLKFCTAMMLLAGGGRHPGPVSSPRRIVWYVPPIDARLWGGPLIGSRMHRLASGLRPEDCRDERDFNNAALLHAQLVFGGEATPEEREPCIAAWRRWLADGLEHFPDSLLLKFNHAHWEFMLDHLESRPQRLEVLEAFGDIIASIDRLHFEPVGSDVGVAYSLWERDRVFPYYDYGQLILRRLVDGKSGRSAGSDLDEPEKAVVAACYAYRGWGLLLSEGPEYEETKPLAEAISLLGKSLEIFPDNQPLLGLLYEALSSLQRLSPAPAIAHRLLEVFFAYANKYPTALLADLAPALHAAEMLRETDTVRYLLDEWYRFARVVTRIEQEDATKRLEWNLTLLQFEAYFPRELQGRLQVMRERSVRPTPGSIFDAAYRDWCLAHDRERMRLLSRRDAG